MEAWRQGDQDAFRVLFTRWAPRLLGVVRRQVRSEDDARDIVQQTFLQLHRARHDYRSGTPLRPWLFTICLNLKREYFRRRARKPEAPLTLDGRSDPVQGAHDPVLAERGRQLHAALASLPDTQRDVIELHWFQGLPFGEVAEVVGASVTAVKVRAHRGYERLRGLLSEQERNQSAPSGIPEGR